MVGTAQGRLCPPYRLRAALAASLRGALATKQSSLAAAVWIASLARNDVAGPVLLHHRRRLPEQQLALFLGADRGLTVVRVDFLGPGIGAHGGGTRGNGFQPALQVGEVVDVLLLVLV